MLVFQFSLTNHIIVLSTINCFEKQFLNARFRFIRVLLHYQCAAVKMAAGNFHFPASRDGWPEYNPEFRPLNRLAHCAKT